MIILDHIDGILQFMTAVAAVAAALFTRQTHSAINQVKVEINGRVSELITSVKALAKAEGVQQERSENKARTEAAKTSTPQRP